MSNSQYFRRSEDNEQITLFQWRDLFMTRYPELHLLHHIPNGGSRDKREAAKLKRMGVKAGVPDIFLPVPKGGRHGLYIELKSGKNTATQEQRQFIADVKALGYEAAVCHGWEEAAAAILRYITGKAVSADDIIHLGGRQ